MLHRCAEKSSLDRAVAGGFEFTLGFVLTFATFGPLFVFVLGVRLKLRELTLLGLELAFTVRLLGFVGLLLLLLLSGLIIAKIPTTTATPRKQTSAPIPTTQGQTRRELLEAMN